MQILHLFEKYDCAHMDCICTLEEVMELLPVTVHSLMLRYTDETKTLIYNWGLPEPMSIPSILLLSVQDSKYIYPDMYDTQEQMMAEILDFFGVLWGENG